ncbi:MAG: hypothetical protein JF589_14410 [Gemmatimonadetes bacterium]|nr:hypothetical protein [Gemmatimonadota bacterium]
MSSPRHSTSLTSDDRKIALERLAAAARAVQAAGADLEQRMAQVRAATTAAELDEVLADVPVVGRAALADSAAPLLVQPPPLEEARLAVLFRHTERNGRCRVCYGSPPSVVTSSST